MVAAAATGAAAAAIVAAAGSPKGLETQRTRKSHTAAAPGARASCGAYGPGEAECKKVAPSAL